MRRSRERTAGFTLVEVIVAAGILTVGLLGVMSSYMVIQRSDRMTREQTAAMLAAQSMIEEIDSFAKLNPTGYPAIVQTTYDKTGFDVFASSYAAGTDRGEMGRGVDVTGGTNAAGRMLVPGDATLYPGSRGAALPAIQAQAGYVTVDLLTGRSDLLQVDVVVTWKTYGGDTRVGYTTIIGPVR